MRERRALAIVLGVVWLVWRLGPSTMLAAAPDVREVTPGWHHDRRVGRRLGRTSGRLPGRHVRGRQAREGCPVEAVRPLRLLHRNVLRVRPDRPAIGTSCRPNNDNYVKLGQTDKLVDGSSGTTGSHPTSRTSGRLAGRRRSISPPAATSATTASTCTPRWSRTPAPSTSAVANRRLDVTIDCSAPPPTPTPPHADARRPTPDRPTPTPTHPTPTPTRRRPRHPDADADRPTPTPTPPTPTPATRPRPRRPTPDADPDPDAATPTPTPTPTPTRRLPRPRRHRPGADADPSHRRRRRPVDPPIIVPKVNDQGTPDTSDDRIVPGADVRIPPG